MTALLRGLAGTRIGEESYKAGTKMTNIVLEILNLQKKEDVTVDLVSNQDFTEVRRDDLGSEWEGVGCGSDCEGLDMGVIGWWRDCKWLRWMVGLWCGDG